MKKNTFKRKTYGMRKSENVVFLPHIIIVLNRVKKGALQTENEQRRKKSVLLLLLNLLKYESNLRKSSLPCNFDFTQELRNFGRNNYRKSNYCKKRENKIIGIVDRLQWP